MIASKTSIIFFSYLVILGSTGTATIFNIYKGLKKCTSKRETVLFLLSFFLNEATATILIFIKFLGRERI
jgi:hypothetical protein